jgi:hypothetical protein
MCQWREDKTRNGSTTAAVKPIAQNNTIHSIINSTKETKHSFIAFLVQLDLMEISCTYLFTFIYIYYNSKGFPYCNSLKKTNETKQETRKKYKAGYSTNRRQLEQLKELKTIT